MNIANVITSLITFNQKALAISFKLIVQINYCTEMCVMEWKTPKLTCTELFFLVKKMNKKYIDLAKKFVHLLT